MLAPWKKKAMTNLDSILKSKDITLPTKVHLVKAMVFPVVLYGCESWTVKKAERWRIDAFELWYWKGLLRVPWTARRSNQTTLKEISPGCSLEGLKLRLKLQYFGHLMQRVDSLKKTLMLEGIGGRMRRGWQRDEMAGWHHWLNGRESEWTPGVGDGQGGLACCDSWGCKESDTTERLNWTELNWTRPLRVPWTARRSNQSILKEISPEYSLEGLMQKLQLQYFSHLMWRANSLEKTLMLEEIEDKRRRGCQIVRWLDSITYSMDMNWQKLWEIVQDRGAWHAIILAIAKSWMLLSNWTTTNQLTQLCLINLSNCFKYNNLSSFYKSIYEMIFISIFSNTHTHR